MDHSTLLTPLVSLLFWTFLNLHEIFNSLVHICTSTCSYHPAIPVWVTTAEQETAIEESQPQKLIMVRSNIQDNLPTEDTTLKLLKVVIHALQGQISEIDVLMNQHNYLHSFPAQTVISFLKAHSPSVPDLQKLVPSDASLNLLHVTLLAMKSEGNENSGHLSLLMSLVTSDSFRYTLNEYLPNGLTPVDLAEKLGLDDAVTIISSAGGRHGIYEMISEEVKLQHGPALLLAHQELMKLGSIGALGQQAVQAVMSQLPGRATVEQGLATEEFYLHQQKVLDWRPDLEIISTYVIGHCNVDQWRRLGFSLKLPQAALSHISSTHSSCEDRYLEVLIYWLDHNEAASWRTLLEVLGHFETKQTMDQLTQDILAAQDSAVS